MIEKITTGFFFTNSYIISNDKGEAIIIDCGFSYDKAYNIIKDKYDVKAILVTHGHFDHVDGLKFFTNKPIYMSKRCEEMLYDPYESLYDEVSDFSPFTNDMLNINYVYDNTEIDLIGYKIRCISTEGHAAGGMTYIIDNNIFSGDIIFEGGGYGRIDFPTGNYDILMESIKKILSYPDDYIIYPGHNNTTTVKEEKKYY